MSCNRSSKKDINITVKCECAPTPTPPTPQRYIYHGSQAITAENETTVTIGEDTRFLIIFSPDITFSETQFSIGSFMHTGGNVVIPKDGFWRVFQITNYSVFTNADPHITESGRALSGEVDIAVKDHIVASASAAGGAGGQVVLDVVLDLKAGDKLETNFQVFWATADGSLLTVGDEVTLRAGGSLYLELLSS